MIEFDTFYEIPTKIDFENKEGKHLLVFVKNTDYQDTQSQKTLQAIIKAIGLDMDKDVIVHIMQENKRSILSDKVQGIKNILCFGINPKDLGIHLNAKLYKIFMFETFNLSIAHKLSDVANDQKNKQILWKVLQTQFSIMS
jgi:hypothetical protein